LLMIVMTLVCVSIVMLWQEFERLTFLQLYHTGAFINIQNDSPSFDRRRFVCHKHALA
jgi:hypothetical protein